MIFGFVLSYNLNDGSLEFSDEDFNEFKEIYFMLREEMIGFLLVCVNCMYLDLFNLVKCIFLVVFIFCNVKWFNVL